MEGSDDGLMRQFLLLFLSREFKSSLSQKYMRVIEIGHKLIEIVGGHELLF